MPDALLDANQRELRMVEIILQARGWRISEARDTGQNLIVIATRERRAEPVEVITLGKGR